MSIGMGQLLLILILFLVIFGAGKLPRVMEDLGKGLKAFKKGMGEDEAASHACQHVQIINKGAETPDVSVSSDMGHEAPAAPALSASSAAEAAQEPADAQWESVPANADASVKDKSAPDQNNKAAPESQNAQSDPAAGQDADQAPAGSKKIPSKTDTKDLAASQKSPAQKNAAKKPGADPKAGTAASSKSKSSASKAAAPKKPSAKTKPAGVDQPRVKR